MGWFRKRAHTIMSLHDLPVPLREAIAQLVVDGSQPHAAVLLSRTARVWHDLIVPRLVKRYDVVPRTEANEQRVASLSVATMQAAVTRLLTNDAIQPQDNEEDALYEDAHQLKGNAQRTELTRVIWRMIRTPAHLGPCRIINGATLAELEAEDVVHRDTLRVRRKRSAEDAAEDARVVKALRKSSLVDHLVKAFVVMARGWNARRPSIADAGSSDDSSPDSTATDDGKRHGSRVHPSWEVRFELLEVDDDDIVWAVVDNVCPACPKCRKAAAKRERKKKKKGTEARMDLDWLYGIDRDVHFNAACGELMYAAHVAVMSTDIGAVRDIMTKRKAYHQRPARKRVMKGGVTPKKAPEVLRLLDRKACACADCRAKIDRAEEVVAATASAAPL